MTDKVHVIISLISFFGFFAFLFYLDTKDDEQPTPWKEEQQSLCLGKQNRARPACWREIDWEVYCERVQCKGSPRQ